MYRSTELASKVASRFAFGWRNEEKKHFTHLSSSGNVESSIDPDGHAKKNPNLRDGEIYLSESVKRRMKNLL